METTRIISSSLISRNRATVETGPRWNRDSKQLVSDQVRFFRCLPAIALLGALFLFAAPPASAEALAAPTGLTVTASDGQLLIEWTLAAQFISDYEVHFTSAPKTGSGAVADTAAASGTDPSVAWVEAPDNPSALADSSWTISGLTHNTTYRVRVRAIVTSLIKGFYESPWAFATGTTPVTRQHLTGLSMSVDGTTVPITHTSTSADGQIWFYTASVTHDTTSVSVTPTWTATGADAQVSSATPDYDNIITNAITVSTSGTSTSVNLASSGDTWVSVALFYVRNAATDYRITVSRLQQPAAPTGLTVTAGDAELLLAWTRPVDDIAGYEVDYTSAGSGAVADTAAASGIDPSVAWVGTRYNPSSSATSWTISGLTNNTDYRVRVRVIVSSFQEGAWAFATGKPVPPRPTLTSLSLSVDGTAVPITHTSTSADGHIRYYTASVPHDTTSVSITPTWTDPGDDAQVGSMTPDQMNTITNIITVSTSGTSNSVNLASSGDTLVWAALFYRYSATTNDYTVTNYHITVSKLQPPAAPITPVDDDEDATSLAQTLPTIRMSVSPNPVDEGSSVTVTLTLSQAAASQVVIPVTLTAIWAESDDYGTLASITIPAGGTTGTGTITTAQDADAEHETFRLVLGAPPAGYTMQASQVQIMIRDDEASQNGGGAAPIAHAIHDNQTPVLSVFGSIVDEGTGVAREGFRVKVKNLTTKASASEITSVETADGYSVTLLDLANARATRVGDVLEISAESPDPRMGVEPVRHIVTVDDVKSGTIELEALIAYEIPAGTELLRNYPNPFNPETWIPYRLAADADVSLTIYDANGALVRSIDVGHQSAAVYESRAKAIYWDGRNEFGEQVASGVYFYSLRAGDFSATRRMVILK